MLGSHEVVSGNTTTWYRVPAVLLVLVPIVLPEYGENEPFRYVLIILMFFGFISSVAWFFRTDSIFQKIGTGILLCWYGLFVALSVLDFVT